MLHSIRGKLLEKSPVHAVVEVNGVGYLVQIPLSTFSQLPDQANHDDSKLMPTIATHCMICLGLTFT